VKRLSVILILLWAEAAAWGWPSSSSPAAQTPHPAVVRVTSIDHDGASLGSGVLVAVNQTHGLIITNWHVVRDSAGTILVSFPDGFTSGARVLKTDSTWDLAALVIWRPNVAPVPLATAPARRGDVLTIAGYGRDSYRAISGYCTEYLSPGDNQPGELVELDVAARQGDSGGPIFNTRGEVAGVLFGSNDSFFTGQYTLGSYCGRVRQFVAAVGSDFQRLPVNPAMVARQGPPVAQPVPAVAIAAAEPPPPNYYPPPTTSAPPPVYRQTEPATKPPAAAATPAVAQPAAVATLSPGPDRTEQIKTILAAIGIFALLFHGIRLLGSAVG
jgi:hypothetical protein